MSKDSDAAPVGANATVPSSDVPITVFAAFNAPRGERQTSTYAALVADLRQPFPRDVPKKELPLWSPATFKDDYRDVENVESAWALGFDVDVEPVPTRDELVAHVQGRAGFIYSSSSDTEEKPRWRLMLVLSRSVSADEYARVWRAVMRSLPFSVGQEAKDAARQWFLPREPDGGAFVFEELVGAPVDVDAMLVAEVPEAAPSGVVLSSSGGARTPKLRATSAAMLASNWPAKGRHAAQLALAGGLCREEWAEDDALEFLCDVCRGAGDEDRPKRAATVRHTYQCAREGKPFTAWTDLEKHIEPAIVRGARKLLATYDGDAIRDAMRPKREDAAAPGAPAGLGFTYGAWDALPPPTEFLVDGLLPRACVGMFFGHADSLKTWLLFSLAIAIANGEPWLGYTTKPAKVGLVDYETGENNIRRRLYMLGAGANPNLGAKSFATLKPSNEAFWTELERERFDLVIVDSLRKANPGANENDSNESIIPLELAAEFSERTGCAVVFIHHAKKSNDEGWPEHRGSAAIIDQVDCSFVVKKSDVSATLKRVDVKCGKPGDMRMPEPFSVEVSFNDTTCTAKVTRAAQEAAKPTTAKDTGPGLSSELLLLIENGNYRAVEDLAKDAKKGKSEVTAALRGHLEARRVVKLDGVYRIDSEEKARARIVAQVDKRRKTTEAAIAKHACVAAYQVQKAIDDGAICETSTGCWFRSDRSGRSENA